MSGLSQNYDTTTLVDQSLIYAKRLGKLDALIFLNECGLLANYFDSEDDLSCDDIASIFNLSKITVQRRRKKVINNAQFKLSNIYLREQL